MCSHLSTMSSAFPIILTGRLPRLSCRTTITVADRLPLRYRRRAAGYRALLPPHAPDMLTVRRQVIDGTGTCTLLDSQPCRLLQCLDHVIIFNETHLRRVLSSYFRYYHKSRTHLSLNKDCPDPRRIQPPSASKIGAFAGGRRPALSLERRAA